ncbi:hypothetical protein ACHQM5_026398 [Ranunculus cassubicifolius]
MELEKPRVTEIMVRMDCNGCVQKIKKALHGINGIYDLYIDFPQQKLTVVGWADPEKIVKAIKKTRKIATICSHTNPNEPPPPTEAAPEAAPPAPENPPPPTESPPAEAAPPTEPPKDPPPPENPPPPEAAPPPADPQPPQPSGPKDVEEIHVIHHHQNDYNYGPRNGHNAQWNSQPTYGQGYWGNHPTPSHGYRPEPPAYATHSYNTYRPSPYISEYQYVQSPPRAHSHYSRREHYSEDYQPRGGNGGDGNNNITSMFSDENPNACTIV